MSCASGQAPISTSFAEQVKGKGIVHLTGWLQLRGEVMLFSSRNAMQAKLQYPSCISGVFKDQEVQNLSYLDGQRVTLTGELFRFDSLANEDAPLLQRKVLAGSVIPNFCFGENVVLVSSIENAER
jgi:hypothetical protein